MSDLALVPDKPPTAKESLRMSLENVIPLINQKTDFANIKGKIEPTRDLILKLIDPFMLSFDTDLKEKERIGDVTYYTFKAEVRGQDGRTVTGWGKCGTDEVNEERAEHDAMTKAETRALKRAIEAKAGYGMVNQLITHFFGGFESKAEPRNVTPPKNTPETTDERKVMLKRLAALGDYLTDEEKAQMRADVVGMSGEALKRYVELWEAKLHRDKGAGVPDEQVAF